MMVVLVALLGAAAAASAAAITWWTAPYRDSLTGALTVSASGAQQVPELVPLALVALAGLGATFATRGRARALIGGLLAACGALLAVHSAIAFGSEPTSVLTDLRRPAQPAGPAVMHPLGPAVAMVGGLLIAMAGVLVLLGKASMVKMGSRYDAPARPKGADVQADLWRALDRGADPTIDQATDRSVADTAGLSAGAAADSPGPTAPPGGVRGTGPRPLP